MIFMDFPCLRYGFYGVSMQLRLAITGGVRPPLPAARSWITRLNWLYSAWLRMATPYNANPMICNLSSISCYNCNQFKSI